jgi:signal transduction histidine kinase
MPANAREIYLQVVRTLPPTEQLHLATLILNDLSQENVSVVEPSDTSIEEDCLDVTTKPIQIEEVLPRVNTYQGLENIQQQLRQEICDRPQAETNLKQTLATLRDAQMELLLKEREKERELVKQVAGVAHEINSPICFISGNISHIKQYVQDLIGHLALYQQHYPNPAAPIQQNAEDIRPLAKKIYVIIRSFNFNRLELTHNCKWLTTNYNVDHNGDGDSDNDSTIF